VSALRLAALVSGSGSNLQSVIDSIEHDSLDAEIVQVIASRAKIPAQERAARYGIPYTVISRNAYKADICRMSDAIVDLLEPLDIDLILLCGYLSFLGESVLARYHHRIMNIHPSLLPAFGGKGMYGTRVHEAVLAYGAKVSGCTVMFVDAGEDTGPIILQRAVPVHDDDTPITLAQRVMQAESCAYPDAVRLFASGRIRVDGCKVIIRKG